MQDVLFNTDFKDLTLYKRGKVRDIYDLEDNLLLVSTDRISCFDVVLPNAIPYKGKVLTNLSCFWFDFIQDITQNHLITADISKYPPQAQKYRPKLQGRSMLVKKTKVFPIECIVRGYLSGSGWKEYQQKQSVCGIELPQGLLESAKLPRVLFTPSTKADTGHDLNVNHGYIENLLGADTARQIKEISIAIYQKASDYALKQGIIIADTKFEFGLYNNEIILIDEVLTPDSSRFWPVSQYQPGKSPPSFDKQFVRDYLESLNWDKSPPAPELPNEIINKTTGKYLEVYKRLTGRELQ